MKSIIQPFLLAMLVAGSCVHTGPVGTSARQLPLNQNYDTYGGNKAGNRYSTLTQINTDNVTNLQLAWTFDTGENNSPDGKGSDIQCQPIVVDGVLYGTSPRMKLFALNAATGKRLWQFDPFADPDRKPQTHPVRGVVYWTDGADKRILYSVGSNLFAINAQTGTLVKSFGKEGVVDLHEGLGDKETLGHEVANLSIRSTSPGVIYKDLIIMGSSVSESGDALPGHLRAFSVRTGKLAWVFHTIPQPGEYGYDTWGKDSYKKLGGANCWAGLVVDEKRGMVFAGTGSPSVDFYGGDRPGQNLFANCVIALNAETGKRIWHYQTIHHDLWDHDLPCQPNLVTVTHNGRKVDAVAQATKDGLIFVLNRDTGEPLFPVNEVPVPTSPALPGERPWPTQPVPVKPAPFAFQNISEAQLTDLTPEARQAALEKYRASRTGKYMPPSLEGNLLLGIGGGAEWGGTATDPEGVLYVNGNNMLWHLKMRDRRQSAASTGTVASRGSTLFNTYCSACHGAEGRGGVGGEGAQTYPALTDVGKRLSKAQIHAVLETGRGRMPAFQHINRVDREAIVNFLLKTEEAAAKTSQPEQAEELPAFPYLPAYSNQGFTQFRDVDNYPAIKPPWGTFNAVDLNTGEYRWQVPFGEYPELTKKGMPPTGTENHGGPVVTAGGLVFIAATYDEHLRAFDRKTGRVLWKYKLPAGGFATPITYSLNGRQYVVIAAGGTRYGLKSGGTYVAFALP